jgi:S-formylglutathione hydrolase FrmB
MGTVFRGVSVDGDGDSWDFGTGAGFYVNATTPGWSKHFRYRTGSLSSFSIFIRNWIRNFFP